MPCNFTRPFLDETPVLKVRIILLSRNVFARVIRKNVLKMKCVMIMVAFREQKECFRSTRNRNHISYIGTHNLSTAACCNLQSCGASGKEFFNAPITSWCLKEVAIIPLWSLVSRVSHCLRPSVWEFLRTKGSWHRPDVFLCSLAFWRKSTEKRINHHRSTSVLVTTGNTTLNTPTRVITRPCL